MERKLEWPVSTRRNGMDYGGVDAPNHVCMNRFSVTASNGINALGFRTLQVDVVLWLEAVTFVPDYVTCVAVHGKGRKRILRTHETTFVAVGDVSRPNSMLVNNSGCYLRTQSEVRSCARFMRYRCVHIFGSMISRTCAINSIHRRRSMPRSLGDS